MAILVRFSKKTRDYIPKRDRVEWWQERVAKLKKELDEIAYDKPEEVEKKKKEIDTFQEEFELQQTLLKKFGPSKFKIKSITKPQIRTAMPDALKKQMINVKEDEGISVGTLEYNRDYATHVCKLGVEGWENIPNIAEDPDSDGKYPQLAFSLDNIDYLDDGTLSELSGEISGTIDKDTIENLK